MSKDMYENILFPIGTIEVIYNGNHDPDLVGEICGQTVLLRRYRDWDENLVYVVFTDAEGDECFAKFGQNADSTKEERNEELSAPQSLRTCSCRGKVVSILGKAEFVSS